MEFRSQNTPPTSSTDNCSKKPLLLYYYIFGRSSGNPAYSHFANSSGNVIEQDPEKFGGDPTIINKATKD